jgi:hypothetical protein
MPNLDKLPEIAILELSMGLGKLHQGFSNKSAFALCGIWV